MKKAIILLAFALIVCGCSTPNKKEVAAQIQLIETKLIVNNKLDSILTADSIDIMAKYQQKVDSFNNEYNNPIYHPLFQYAEDLGEACTGKDLYQNIVDSIWNLGSIEYNKHYNNIKQLKDKCDNLLYKDSIGTSTDMSCYPDIDEEVGLFILDHTIADKGCSILSCAFIQKHLAPNPILSKFEKAGDDSWFVTNLNTKLKYLVTKQNGKIKVKKY